MTTSAEMVQATKNEITYTPIGSTEEIKLSMAIIEKTLLKPTRSGAMPEYQDKVAFMMTCKHLHLNPYLGEIFLVGYDGANGPEFSIILGQPAFLKRAEVHPAFDGMESGLIFEDMSEEQGDFVPPGKKAIGAWARVFRNDRKVQTYRRLNIEKYNKNRSYWKVNAEMMAVKCAEVDALRSAFPSALGGMYSQEEMPLQRELKNAYTIDADPLPSDDDGDFAPQPKAIEKPKASAKPQPKPASKKPAEQAPEENPKAESAPAPAAKKQPSKAPTTAKQEPSESPTFESPVDDLKVKLQADGIYDNAIKFMIDNGYLPEGEAIESLRVRTAESILNNYGNFKQSVIES